MVRMWICSASPRAGNKALLTAVGGAGSIRQGCSTPLGGFPVGEPAKDEMKGIDGKWNRFVTVDRITLSGMTDWVVTGPLQVLEMRDPDTGVGSDDKAKPRHQYVLSRLGIFSRCLPPESFGDVWRNEQEIRLFMPADVSDYIAGLLGA